MDHVINKEEYEIVSRCLKNDREAQEALYRRYADKMFSVCLYYADDRDEACDFLQEGFLMVFRKLNQFKFNGSLEGWVRRVIVNTTLGHLRKKKRYNLAVEAYEIEIKSLEGEEIELESIPFKKVISTVNSLPGKAALVLKLFAIEGYTHPEISEIMGITVGTSKSQLNRARALLKAELEKINE